MPQVVIAHRLNDGIVVFLGVGGSWVESVDDSAVANSEEESGGLMETAQRSEDDQTVLGAELIDVSVEGKTIRPTKYRELIRATGPTVRADLGKQAGN